MIDVEKLEDVISIGELARLTGITTHTLRVWEKRYGTPKAHRLPSGHRRYPKEDVPRLRTIAKALDSGYRASKVVTGTLEQLHSLIGLQPFIESTSNLNSPREAELLAKESLIEKWIKYVHDYDDDHLLNAFHLEWGSCGSLNFVLHYAVPFLNRIGIGWEENELSVAHEHFATECMVGFISEKWRQMNVRKNGTRVVVATLPGESYNLGALMCAVVTTVTNSKVIYLGNDTPIDEIIGVSKQHNPSLIALSVSHAMSSELSKDCIFKLRDEINKNILIVTGGKGSPFNIPGVSHISCFEKYYNFLTKLNQSEYYNAD